MYPISIDKLQMWSIEDECTNLDIVRFNNVTGGGGTNLANSASGGSISLVTLITANDFMFRKSVTSPFLMAPGKPIWFATRTSVTEGSVSKSSWLSGLSSNVAGTIMTAATGVPINTFSGALWYKVDGSMALNFISSNGTTQTIAPGVLTLVSGQTYQMGFHWDSNDGITSLVNGWVVDETAGRRFQVPPQPVAVAGLLQMGMMQGIKAGAAGAAIETLTVDYIYAAQKR